MHILLVNDDGPPSNQSSPYIHTLVQTLQAAGHKTSVVLPNVQRSWIGKAHMVGQTLTPSYFRPGSLLKDDGVESGRPFNDGGEEWILLDGTPASCVQVGLHHVFKDEPPFDLVLSGPNYGRNTTAVFALSSGTLGAAMEGAVNGKKAIALSYAFDSREHDLDVIKEASQLSTKLVEKLYNEWPSDVHLFSINVPLRKGVTDNKILYTEMIQNSWTSGSTYDELPANSEDADPEQEENAIRADRFTNGDKSERKPRRSHVTYKWAPKFTDVRKAVEDAKQGDGWEVSQGNVSVTPLRANFWHLPHYRGEIKLYTAVETPRGDTQAKDDMVVKAYIHHPDLYVQPLIVNALQHLGLNLQIVETPDRNKSLSATSLQFTDYENIDFEHAMQHSSTSLVCAYVIRKALIRKHYLANTISTWVVKHPDSLLAKHFKLCVHFELDYAEFLEDALVDSWDLNESMERNANAAEGSQKEWWILKPGMSDGGNGLKLFSSLEHLQSIFEEWEQSDAAEDDDADSANDNAESPDETRGTLTSQLRDFIAQPYLDRPLLLDTYQGRKFHVRAYVLAVGALKIFVYREMLALFAAKPYVPPVDDTDGLDLAQHLTNTCFQDESTKSTSVHRFSHLESNELASNWQDKVYNQICDITGEVFEAAAREQMVHFQVLPNAFELFGVDFLVDNKLKVWLLELNAYPDLKQTGDDLREIVVGGLFEGIANVAVAPFFRVGDGHDSRMKLVRHLDLGRS